MYVQCNLQQRTLQEEDKECTKTILQEDKECTKTILQEDKECTKTILQEDKECTKTMLQEDNLSIMDTIAGPNASHIRGFTVHSI